VALCAGTAREVLIGRPPGIVFMGSNKACLARTGRKSPVEEGSAGGKKIKTTNKDVSKRYVFVPETKTKGSEKGKGA